MLRYVCVKCSVWTIYLNFVSQVQENRHLKISSSCLWYHYCYHILNVVNEQECACLVPVWISTQSQPLTGNCSSDQIYSLTDKQAPAVNRWGRQSHNWSISIHVLGSGIQTIFIFRKTDFEFYFLWPLLLELHTCKFQLHWSVTET